MVGTAIRAGAEAVLDVDEHVLEAVAGADHEAARTSRPARGVHFGSESIGSGRAAGGVPSPVIVPGPSRLRLRATARRVGRVSRRRRSCGRRACAAGAGDGCDPPQPTLARIATPRHRDGHEARHRRAHFVITPQAMRSPALPDGSVFMSSAAGVNHQRGAAIGIERIRLGSPASPSGW